VFEEERLLEITPDHAARHFKKMAYGTPTPGPRDKPVYRRSSVQSSDHDAFSVSHHRSNDISHIQTKDLRSHPQFPCCLLTTKVSGQIM
jgi:hypothetical protein